jgi:hypothetical protein
MTSTVAPYPQGKQHLCLQESFQPDSHLFHWQSNRERAALAGMRLKRHRLLRDFRDISGAEAEEKATDEWTVGGGGVEALKGW